MMREQEIDKILAVRLNILRAGVLGANDGIISIAGVVIGVEVRQKRYLDYLSFWVSSSLCRSFFHGRW